MSNNTLAGILIAIVVVGGGIYLLTKKPSAPTPAVTDNTGGTVAGTNTSGSSNTTPPPKKDAPEVETGVSIGVSSSTAAVSGRVKPNGVSTTYWFEYGETTALGSRTTAQKLGSGFSFISTPGYITGLKANTVYYYRLSAKNSFATVNGETKTLQTNNTPPIPGVAPTVRTTNVTGITRTTANVNGQVNPNGWQTNFWFEYGKDSSLGFVTALQSAGDGSALQNVSMSLSGLDPLTKYYYRLNAQNQYGTVNGSILNFTTSGPVAPSAPSVTTNSATNITATGATLNGRINPNGVESSYWFEYGQDSLLGTLIGTTSPAQSIPSGTDNVNVEQNLSGLSSNTRYYYRLVGRNSYGTVYGNIISFTTRTQ